MLKIDQKSLFWRQSQKNMLLLPLFVQVKLKKDKNSNKLIFSFLHLKHPIRCCVFSFLWVFADSLNYMPNKIKNWKIWWKVEFFALFAMKLKKSAKIAQNEKTQHVIRYYKSRKQFKIHS